MATSSDALSLDSQVVLVNNILGRDFGDKFDSKKLMQDKQYLADFLNGAAVQILSSLDEYKNRPELAKILSGEVKIFNADDKTVWELQQMLIKATEGNFQVIKNNRKKKGYED
jgi:hypothetical protein